MMTEFRYAGVAVRLAVLALLPVCAALAQDVVDEDSLLAKEELTINEAVQGALPDVSGNGDDFLKELLADEGAKAPAEVPADLPLALDATPAPDAGLSEAPAAVTDMPAGETLPASLDAVVEGVAAEPAADIDAFPLDAGFDANAVVGEMLEAGKSDVAKELGTVEEKPELAASGATAAAEVDLDKVLGEMVGEEKPGAVAAPVAEEAVATVAEPVADTEKKGAAVAEGADAPLDFLFGEAEPAAAPAPVETKAADSSLDQLVGELAVEAEADLGGGVAAAGVDAVIPESTPAVAETVAEPVAEAVEIAAEPTAEPVAIAAEPVAEAVEIAAEPTAEPVAIAAEPVAVETVDPMALDDDIFKELASEAKVEMKQVPAAQESVEQASEVAADPFVGLPGDLAGETDSGVKPDASSSSASVPAATPTAVSAAGDKAVAPAALASADPSVQVAKPESRVVPAGLVAFEEAERLKRGAQEYHAKSTLSSAEKALRAKDYPTAIRLYEESRRYMPKRPDTEALQAQARKGLAAAYYEQALSLERMEDYENAKLSAQNAVRNGDQRGEVLVVRVQDKMDAPPPPAAPAAKFRWKEDDYKSTQLQINSWMKQGREAYLTGEYDKSILAFESVLARDPENKEAIRLMHSASNKQFDRSTMELNATASRMMASVRDTWNPRQYGLHEAPIRDDGRMVTDRQEDELQRMAIVAKMGLIRIPEVDFRQANIRDVVNFLFQQSAEFDPDPLPANRKGVNIILKLDSDAPGGQAAPAAPADPFSAAPAAAGGPGGGGGNETLVTFSARDITLKEALDIVVDIAGLKYLIRGNVVMVMPRDAAVGEIEHRMYDVLPSAITRLQELSTAVSGGPGGGAQRGGGAGDFLALEGSGGTGGEDVDLKAFFTEMGVDWPTRSSIKFVRGLGKLVVANTIENLTVFEKVLSILNVVPYQIEIEARFIEVAQTDVDSLGLEWMLNDNWELAQKKGSAGVPLATRERIEMDANAAKGGFTSGNRFLTGAGLSGATGGKIADQIASLSGVLTNPELTMVLHALQQRGHTDLLSAPKITTQSGQQAVIKVVTEYIYPTEFEVSGIGGDTGGNAAGGGGNGGGAVGAVVTPREFTTREVGVILEVLPEVSPEGQMINLTLSPEVVSEPEWKNYGSTYTQYDLNGNPVSTQTLNMEQPFFHTRKLKTNLLIYNGATVVMGGMITEVRENVDDKIPLLGDIPLLGRLFRSRYESSEKRNLLIFVTARLVDPAGRALDRDRFTVDKGIAERIAVGGGGGGEAAPAAK
jgi:general secretion pathway protein D